MTNKPQEEDFLQMLLVTNMRIYDVLLLILQQLNSKNSEKIDGMHEKFEFFGNLPWTVDDENGS